MPIYKYDVMTERTPFNQHSYENGLYSLLVPALGVVFFPHFADSFSVYSSLVKMDQKRLKLRKKNDTSISDMAKLSAYCPIMQIPVTELAICGLLVTKQKQKQETKNKQKNVQYNYL